MKSPSTRSNRPSCPCWWAPSQVSRGLKDQPLGFTYLHILNNLMYFLISCRVKTSEFSFPLPRTDTVIEGCCIHLQKDQISQERIRAIVYKINTVNRIDKTYTTKVFEANSKALKMTFNKAGKSKTRFVNSNPKTQQPLSANGIGIQLGAAVPHDILQDLKNW
eukprot:3933036-Rhodomonas_salina.2